MARAIPTADRVHAFLMSGFAVATVAYWVKFFTTGNVKTSDDPAYVDFEQAFPLADAYMAGAFLLAARNLQRQRPEAVPTGIAAGSAMVFLGGMDLLS